MSAIQMPPVTTATINAGFPIGTPVSDDFSTSLPSMMPTQVGAPVTFTAIVTESAPTSKVHVPTYLKVIDATTPTEPDHMATSPTKNNMSTHVTSNVIYETPTMTHVTPNVTTLTTSEQESALANQVHSQACAAFNTACGADMMLNASVLPASAMTANVSDPASMMAIPPTANTSNGIPEHVEATFPGSVTFPTNYGATVTKEVTTTSSGFGSTTITKEVTTIPGFGRTTVTKQVTTNQGFGGVNMAPTTTTMTSTSTVTAPVISQAAGRSVAPVKVQKESKGYRIRGLFGRGRRF